MDVAMGRRTPDYIPTRKEIEIACRNIREGWSDRVRKKRKRKAHGDPPPVTAPEVSLAQIEAAHDESPEVHHDR